MSGHSFTQREKEREVRMARAAASNQQVREERTAQILEVAAKVFARKGLAETKITDIAAAGGMSQGLVYRYFVSKEEIFSTLVEQSMNAAVRLAQQALEQPGTPREKLSWLLAQILPDVRERPAYSLVVLHALTNEAVATPIRELALRQVDVMGATIRQLISEGQAAGQVVAGNPDELVLLYQIVLQGLAAGAMFLHYTSDVPSVESLLRILEP
jgi:AcrR family transcriptional regulator